MERRHGCCLIPLAQRPLPGDRTGVITASAPLSLKQDQMCSRSRQTRSKTRSPRLKDPEPARSPLCGLATSSGFAV